MEIPIQVPEQFRPRYEELTEALGRASMKLHEASLAYQELIGEKLRLNEEIRRYEVGDDY